MSKQHSNIVFSVEAEKNGAFPFLDIKINRKNYVCTQIKNFKFLILILNSKNFKF